MKLRFAPSPTGYLHVGNARQAIANALFARHHGADFVLRIDDTDLERSKEEYTDNIKKDLQWLGIQWGELVFQSHRLERYQNAIEQLKQLGRLYPCFETEEELAAKREMRIKQGKPPIYDRAMLKMTAEQRARAEANGKVPYWRFRLSDRIVSWEDMVMGKRQVKLPSLSDPVLVRADGTILYTLASVVDDIELGITHIIRGEDHVTNTGVQLDIIEALEPGKKEQFSFGHLPLLLDSDGGKLSKRFDGLSLKTLRADGVLPLAIVSYLARLGTSQDPQPLDWDSLAKDYSLSYVSRAPARFDIRQLVGLNRQYLRTMPFELAKKHLPAEATEPFWLAIRSNIDVFSEARMWWKVTLPTFIPPVIEGEKEFMVQAMAHLPEEPWDGTTWKIWMEALAASTGKKGKALYHPVRMALTGEEKGPELKDFLLLIGRSQVLSRLREATL
ncbi:glutamate--tRNA ligase [Entomobacter blattae]|uniref:Glutamate--tRNA ligase n=1 Tax=Entomobacter blattae TaxID=2762277 RepID=A0A7H1NUL1_9PROT|nr:glutamate--tRNA ligase [Entomobacter blattae]QNT79471.1 Glutamate--tRNA ligase 1 [Entomobacter blattae]